MFAIGREIYRAVHESKWLSIEYRNLHGEVTRYWIGIRDVDPVSQRLRVRGMHLATHEVRDFERIAVKSILSCEVVDGTFFAVPEELVRDIDDNPERYAFLFGNVPNLRVLSYYEDCLKLDAVPFSKDFGLVERLDVDRFSQSNAIRLDEVQFKQLVRSLQKKGGNRQSNILRGFDQPALNLMSVQTQKGLYVLAYRKLKLDIEQRSLVLNENITICRRFALSNGAVRSEVSLARYLDEPDQHLLSDFEANAERIKDLVSRNLGVGEFVSDIPYATIIGRTPIVDLKGEFAAIQKMYAEQTATIPVRAFFGDVTVQPDKTKSMPVILRDKKANFDQLLAIHSALGQSLSYVQGPPGTGKTSTIVNTIISAFFNGMTVLFCSNNNHPIDGVCQALSLDWNGRQIRLPFIRLGNQQVTADSLEDMQLLYQEALRYEGEAPVPTFNEQREAGAEELSRLLRDYKESINIQEKCECIAALIGTSENEIFAEDLTTRQFDELKKRMTELSSTVGNLTTVLAHLEEGKDEAMNHLRTASFERIRRLGRPENSDLFEIVMSSDKPLDRARRFNKLLNKQDVLTRLLQIFPIVATTCISARNLGEPMPSFDMTVIDEASQCGPATSLIPIVRGKRLMLVGDPQQLNPVTLLSEEDNRVLKRNYSVSDEYDYAKQSIYKVFLACDPISTEVLLRKHYRCDEQIIGFNNKKFYRGRLQIMTGRHEPDALTLVDVRNGSTLSKNTSPAEAEYVVDYAMRHPEKSVAIITPFVNQKEYIARELEQRGVTNAVCGTVHSFQGDEQDVVLLSLALTDRTSDGTYRWLASNRELINVATSRARDSLVLVTDREAMENLHARYQETDDIYELAEYVRTNGSSEVSEKSSASRALGIKPYSTKTEGAFLETLGHALGNINIAERRYEAHREVPISHVFNRDFADEDLYFSGRFDFVIYEMRPGGEEVPILAIELDGLEHHSDAYVKARDAKKEAICERHGFRLIRVDNTYARRYALIKNMLQKFFNGR